MLSIILMANLVYHICSLCIITVVLQIYSSNIEALHKYSCKHDKQLLHVRIYSPHTLLVRPLIAPLRRFWLLGGL